MKIDQNTMDAMHDIQYEMLKELIGVMNQLNIRYYFVHGSLLGAVRDHDFIPEDDDIDIAIFREDYNRLMLHGQALMKDDYFLQNSVNDKFPLSFGKMRKNDTAFIQPVLEKVKCHKGIYIDIFPIDFEDDSLSFRIKKFIYENRIAQMLKRNEGSVKSRIVGLFVKFACFSWDRALLKRELLYSSAETNKLTAIYGGKHAERQMPAEWFKAQLFVKFRDLEVACPIEYEKYLERIYGADFLNHNPARQRIEEKGIEISADVLDFQKSYLDYSTE